MKYQTTFYVLFYIVVVSVVVGWCSRAGAMPPYPHDVAVLPPLPHAFRNGKSSKIKQISQKHIGIYFIYIMVYSRTAFSLFFYLFIIV